MLGGRGLIPSSDALPSYPLVREHLPLFQLDVSNRRISTQLLNKRHGLVWPGAVSLERRPPCPSRGAFMRRPDKEHPIDDRSMRLDLHLHLLEFLRLEIGAQGIREESRQVGPRCFLGAVPQWEVGISNVNGTLRHVGSIPRKAAPTMSQSPSA